MWTVNSECSSGFATTTTRVDSGATGRAKVGWVSGPEGRRDMTPASTTLRADSDSDQAQAQIGRQARWSARGATASPNQSGCRYLGRVLAPFSIRRG